jgi:hypothetical protein
MEPNPNNNIVIRLEVLIPHVPGQPAPVITAKTHESPPPATAPAPQTAMKTAASCITCPTGATAKVKVNYGYESGVIFIAGRATVSYPYGKPRVWAKIYPNLTASIPEDHIDAGATDLGVTDDDGFWFRPEFGTAVCGPDGNTTKNNRLAVWLVYDGYDHPTTCIQPFIGICSEDTDDCARVQQSAAKHHAPPTTIVPAWELTASGFGGKGITRFNREWQLELSETPYRWTSGDAEGKPRVELFLTRPCHSKWKLVFSTSEYKVEYVLAAEHWSPDGANIFTTVRTFGLPLDASVPGSIVITPAEAEPDKPARRRNGAR